MQTRPHLGGITIAVLGWAGSTERQLRGVVRWYRERGAEVVTHRAGVFRAMARPDGWRIEGRRLAERLAHHEGPVVVHLFSNAGFWTWAAALEAAPRLVDRVKAVIVDSAPGIPRKVGPRFYSRYSAMAMMPLLLRTLGRPAALEHPVLTPATEAFMRLWYYLSVPQRRFAERSLEVARTDRPHLFLYSTADSLVRHAHVDAFFTSLPDATRVVWHDSEHVTHMVRHRKAYFEAVATFLARALSDRPAQ